MKEVLSLATFAIGVLHGKADCNQRGTVANKPRLLPNGVVQPYGDVARRSLP